MIRIAAMVSGGGTNLQALINADNPYGSIELVIASRPGIYAIDRAAAAGIPSLIISKRKLGEAFTDAMLSALREFDIQLIVLAGYLTILPARIIHEYDGRIINIHPALLPSFGGLGFYGLAVHEAALARGVKVTGATVHLVNAEPDGGPILAQQTVDVLPGDTPETLQKRVMEQAEWHLLPREVMRMCQSMITSS
jgi:phosphoribosylglycinamide formyltransferase-1